MGEAETAGRAALERAMEHDRAGREAEAIPEYEDALRRGLDDELAAGALLGLGSSLRNVDRAAEAVELLAVACGRFPEHAGLRLFRALALASAGRCDEGLGDALRVAAERIDTPDVRSYRRALELYADELARRA